MNAYLANHMNVTRIALCCSTLIGMTPSSASAATASYRVSQAEVIVICPLTVGGRFEAKTTVVGGELELDAEHPGALNGAVSVDLRTLRTGIGLRDAHLREKYLEVQRGSGFDTATLKNVRVAVPGLRNFRGKAPFQGILTVHGEDREIGGTAEIADLGSGIRVAAVFDLRISDFQIARPAYLGVGVSNNIQVKVNLTASAARAADARKVGS